MVIINSLRVFCLHGRPRPINGRIVYTFDAEENTRSCFQFDSNRFQRLRAINLFEILVEKKRFAYGTRNKQK